MKKQIEEEFQKNLKLFINECMCRRESNQRKADALWDKIKPHIKLEDIARFITEWKGHYIHTSEHSPDAFAEYIDEILNPYINK